VVIDTYLSGRPSERQERHRFGLYFATSELARLPVARLDAGRIETFLQGWSGRLGPESHEQMDKLSSAVPPMGLAHLLPTNASRPAEGPEVPTEKTSTNSDVEWRARLESNQRPSASETDALSI
jgi:hypothetical protein